LGLVFISNSKEIIPQDILEEAKEEFEMEHDLLKKMYEEKKCRKNYRKCKIRFLVENNDGEYYFVLTFDKKILYSFLDLVVGRKIVLHIMSD
jgi:hypothetical protein